MKLISFLSRFTFISNICFLLFVIFSKIEAHKAIAGTGSTVNVLPFFKELVIVLGFSAIIINLAMCLVYLVVWIIRKSFVLPKWLSIINVIFLIAQFYYFFFYK